MLIHLKKSIPLFVLLNFICTSSSQAVRWQDLDEERKTIVMKMNVHRQAYSSGVDRYFDYLDGIQYLISCGCTPEKTTEFTKPDILVDWKKNFKEIKTLISQGTNEQIFSEENKKRLQKAVKGVYKGVAAGLSSLEKEFKEQNAKEYSGLNTDRLSNLIKEFKETTLPESFGGMRLPLIAHKLWDDVETDSSVAPTQVAPAPKEEPKPVLSSRVLGLQKKLQNAFEKRQRREGGETVMAFGSHVAPKYYYQIQSCEEEIFGHPPTILVSMTDLSKVQDFYNQLKESNIINIGNELEAQMHSALGMSENRTTSDTTITNPKEFLLRTFGLLEMQYRLHGNSKEMVNLLSIAFSTFAEQNRNCVRGLLGRTFQIYKEIFDFGISFKLNSTQNK
jgi:hypothetical protein